MCISPLPLTLPLSLCIMDTSGETPPDPADTQRWPVRAGGAADRGRKCHFLRQDFHCGCSSSPTIKTIQTRGTYLHAWRLVARLEKDPSERMPICCGACGTPRHSQRLSTPPHQKYQLPRRALPPISKLAKVQTRQEHLSAPNKATNPSLQDYSVPVFFFHLIFPNCPYLDAPDFPP